MVTAPFTALPSPTATSMLQRLAHAIASPLFWGGLLALGVVWRCRLFLAGQSYWYDESALVLVVRERGFLELFGGQAYNLVSPPLFLWIERALFVLGGQGELVLRLPAFLAGIAAMFVMWPLAKRIAGPVQGVWALGLLALSRHAVSHGCETRAYTLDLMLAAAILLATTVLLDAASSLRGKRWAVATLFLLALLSPWLSFPSPLVLGGASLALAVHGLRNISARHWMLWALGNGAVLLSALALWWFSGRHMYYTGMIEHWGHTGGWRGFPDWNSPWATFKWVLWRPCEVGYYGTREMGIPLALLAVLGCVHLARRAPALAILLVTPFALAIGAALLGKYPLAHRTGMFLLPSLWLLAAAGIDGLAQWASRRKWQLSGVGLVLLAFDFFWLPIRLVVPEPGVDYRGAYQYLQQHRQVGEPVWAHMATVYESYYGKDPDLLRDEDLPRAIQLTEAQRLWVVVSSDRRDLQRDFASRGWSVALRHHVAGLDVLLIEPRRRDAAR